MKYKQDIRLHHVIYVYKYGLYFLVFLFFRFYKYQDKESPLTTFEQFPKRTFGGICCKCLTTSAYMELLSM